MTSITSHEREMLRAAYGPLRQLANVVAPRGVAADDLVHDAFVKLLERGIADVRDPHAFLRRIVVNLAISEHRRSGAQQRAMARHGIDSIATSAIYPSDLSELQHLTPRARALVLFVDIDGAPIKEAAKETSRGGNSQTTSAAST